MQRTSRPQRRATVNAGVSWQLACSHRSWRTRIYYVPGVPFAVGQVVGFGVVLMPICIAYAVFRLRVLDVNFVLNRALVYGVLSLGVIAFISILDWFFSRVVALGRFAIGLELLATIAIGFLLDRIDRSVEGFVEARSFGGADSPSGCYVVPLRRFPTRPTKPR